MNRQGLELQDGGAFRERVIALVSVLNAVEEADVDQPQVMADPGQVSAHAADAGAHANALNLIAGRGEGGRKRIEQTPDVGCAGEGGIELSIRSQLGAGASGGLCQ